MFVTTSVTRALCMSKFLSVMEEMRAASFKSYKSYGQSRLIIIDVDIVILECVFFFKGLCSLILPSIQERNNLKSVSYFNFT